MRGNGFNTTEMQLRSRATCGLAHPNSGNRPLYSPAPGSIIDPMSVDDTKPDKQTQARPAAEQTLKQEISQLQHELRRVRDGLERDPSQELERRARQLSENIVLCERDLHSGLQKAVDSGIQLHDGETVISREQK